MIDLDATLVTAHSEKQDATGNVKGGYGHHPLGAWLDNTNEALAMLLRPGNTGSNTASDHRSVLEHALAQIPERWRSKKILIRADGTGYSHALITALSEQGLGFSVDYTVPKRSGTRSVSFPRTPGRRRTTPTAACGSTPTSSRSPACSTSVAGPRPAPGCESSSAASTTPRRDPGHVRDPGRLPVPGLHHQHPGRATRVPRCQAPRPRPGREPRLCTPQTRSPRPCGVRSRA